MNDTTLHLPAIAILCPCLEPGRDGVGDYCRLLARGLAEKGSRVALVSLVDPFVNEISRQSVEAGIEVMRLPAAHWQSGDLVAVESLLKEFNPDWVSLQIVCWAYDRRGIVWAAPERLSRLMRFGRRHIMYHELWLGEVEGDGLKFRLLGGVQRLAMLRLHKRWAPTVTHCNTPTYRLLLSRHRIEAGVLPLPTNIAILRGDALETEMAAVNSELRVISARPEDLWVVGLFGALHPHPTLDQVVDELCAHASRESVRLVFAQLGNAGEAGQRIWQHMIRQADGRYECLTLGRRSAAAVSAWMQRFDLGLSFSPWALIGKSSAAATMLAHGVPVHVGRMDWALRNGPTPDPMGHPLLYRAGKDFSRALAANEIRRAAPSNVGLLPVADMLVEDLRID